MNKHAGKARIGVMALLAAAAFAIVGLHSSSGHANPTPTPTPTPAGPLLCVTDGYTNALTAYPAASAGNAAPIATITGLSSPQGVALDSSGNIYVANDNPASVVVYAAGSTGAAAPIATISGSNTGLLTPLGVALDSSGNIYVTDAGDNLCDGTASVFVYPAGSTGDAAPSATISGPPSVTKLCYPMGITLDSSGSIYVADENGVLVYPAGSKGDAAPIATIPAYGANDGLLFRRRAGLSGRDQRRRRPQRPNPQLWGQRRPAVAIRHCSGFQRQHLCGGQLHRQRVCLSGREQRRRRTGQDHRRSTDRTACAYVRRHPAADCHAYCDRDADRHCNRDCNAYSNCNCNRNCYSHSYKHCHRDCNADCDGDCHCNADCDCNSHRDCNADGDCHRNCHANSDADHLNVGDRVARIRQRTRRRHGHKEPDGREHRQDQFAGHLKRDTIRL